MRALVLIALFFSVLGSVSQAAKPNLVDHRWNLLGFADREGCLSIWWKLGKGLPAVEGELPVFVHYGSSGRMRPASCLGLGWMLPVFDAGVVPLDEVRVLAWLPSGSMVPLYKKNNQSLEGDRMEWNSKDTLWSATQKDETFVLAGPSGVSVEYRHGRIKSVSFPNGKGLVWKDEPGGKVILDTQGKVQLSGRLSSKSGLLHELEYPGPNAYKVVFQQGKAPIPASSGVALAGLVDSCRGFTESNGYSCDAICELVPDAPNSILRVLEHQPDKYRQEKNFVWENSSSRIISDGESSYAITKPSNATGESINVVRELISGGTETWAVDRKQGTETYTKDGVTRTVKYVATPGVARGKPMSVSFDYGGNRPSTTERISYDTQGRVIRVVSQEGTRLYSYMDNGTFQIRHFSASSSLDSPNCIELLDAAGGVKERTWPQKGVIFRYEPPAGRYQNVQVTKHGITKLMRFDRETDEIAEITK